MSTGASTRADIAAKMSVKIAIATGALRPRRIGLLEPAALERGAENAHRLVLAAIASGKRGVCLASLLQRQGFSPLFQV